MGSQIDVLQETLASGVRVQKYVTSYGDLPNDFPNVVGCKLCDDPNSLARSTDPFCADFKAKFMGLHVRHEHSDWTTRPP